MDFFPKKNFELKFVKVLKFRLLLILLDKNIVRGCMSDSTEQRLLCESANKYNNGSCVVCNGSDCNNQPKYGKAKLSCMSCSGAEDCAFGFITSTLGGPMTSAYTIHMWT